ncbi:hypothetical protein J437_LFUL012119 [Ladona fulva]|uniref:Uncharacterized protein n=1 Tax=Ladona fulva TaxID=123851 RepID=A0A8K0P3W1_LADFU|nr:hypothetical protein J437_LFUL012119 [Ladona fulva]
MQISSRAIIKKQSSEAELRNLVNTIYKVGYSISLAALLLSLAIFFYFKSLSCTRIQIHKNLFISLALNNALWLVWYEEILDNPVVLSENGVRFEMKKEN